MPHTKQVALPPQAIVLQASDNGPALLRFTPEGIYVKGRMAKVDTDASAVYSAFLEWFRTKNPTVSHP